MTADLNQRFDSRIRGKPTILICKEVANMKGRFFNRETHEICEPRDVYPIRVVRVFRG